MTLTETKLKDLIQQVYLEAFEDLLNDPDIELPAEPEFEGEEPPVLNESKRPHPHQKLYKVLRMLNDDERARIFQRFGYYTQRQLLSHLNALKKAEKGKL